MRAYSPVCRSPGDRRATAGGGRLVGSGRQRLSAQTEKEPIPWGSSWFCHICLKRGPSPPSGGSHRMF